MTVSVVQVFCISYVLKGQGPTLNVSLYLKKQTYTCVQSDF